MKSLKLTLVCNREKRLNRNGTSLVQLRIHYNRDNRYYSTGIYLKPGQWDENKERVIKHNNVININRFLDSIKMKAENFYLESVLSNKSISALSVKDHLNNKGSDFVVFAEEHINNKKAAESTIKQSRTLLRYLKAFSSPLYYENINYTFISRFESFLIKQKNDRTNKPLSLNYIASLIVILRGIINKARAKELIKIDPFLDYKFTREKKTHEYLTTEEISKLENIDVSNRHGQVPLSYEVFLVSNYTGLRFSDLYGGKNPDQGLRVKHIRKLKDEYRLQKILFKNRERHPVRVDIPLNLLYGGKALKFLLKHIRGKDIDDLVFGSIDNGTYNDHVRIFLELAKINKVITGHSARRSLAQYLLDNNISKEIIGQILGHSSVKTTEIYANKANYKLVDEALRKLG